MKLTKLSVFFAASLLAFSANAAETFDGDPSYFRPSDTPAQQHYVKGEIFIPAANYFPEDVKKALEDGAISQENLEDWLKWHKEAKSYFGLK